MTPAANLPLDVVVVRKLGVPGHEEYAFGAIAPDQIAFIDQPLVARLDLQQPVIEQIIKEQTGVLNTRQTLYREDREPLNLANRTVILVDDGMATGATMLAAAAFAKSQNAAEIVVVLPVAPIDAPEIFGGIANLICPHIRTDLAAVGQYYEVFDQVEGASVQQLLAVS